MVTLSLDTTKARVAVQVGGRVTTTWLTQREKIWTVSSIMPRMVKKEWMMTSRIGKLDGE